MRALGVPVKAPSSDELGQLPERAGARMRTCSFAVFDEFGLGADDRVQDYAAECVASERERCARSMKLADDRLKQMYADRDQALHWKVALDKALTVCHSAARVVDSSAYQGVSDEDCDLENAVRNWRTAFNSTPANFAPLT